MSEISEDFKSKEWNDKDKKELMVSILSDLELTKKIGVTISEQEIKKQMLINKSKGIAFKTKQLKKAQAILDLVIEKDKE